MYKTTNSPIIHTTFLDDICDQLVFTAYNAGYKNLVVSVEWLSDHMELAIEMIQKNIRRIVKELAEYTESNDSCPYEYREGQQELEAEGHLLLDLGIIQDLEGVDYAAPNHIASSVEILSAKLSEQLEAKLHEEANYNEYYCKSLAWCLSELCELIKEV